MHPRSAIALALPLLVACGDPCRALSEKICRCRPTQAERASCLANVAAQVAREVPLSQAAERAAQAQCAALIDGCSCAALAAGHYDACGMGTPAAAAPTAGATPAAAP